MFHYLSLHSPLNFKKYKEENEKEMLSLRKQRILLFTMFIVVLLIVGSFSVAAQQTIKWKSSSFGPATNYSQIHHDKACADIT